MASVPVMRLIKGIGEHLILSRINVRCKEMASRNFAVANTILVAGVSEPWSLPTNLCEIDEGGRLLNCSLSMDVFSLIYGPVVFHRTAVQRPQSRSICSTVSGVLILQNRH
ncbi:hypothetical protein AYI69_g7523 [Smittium culicis]|uniref:Uncharacterized protein n=1 Tax=Smittium culicis TaxID=133412 RepID=A0A1R1XRC1_9FUNG|nr:hypothetical protein AYI69_g7523 [Smittium culicis]